jgi:hypothetical protein
MREQKYMKAVNYYLKADQVSFASNAASHINSANLAPADLLEWHLISADLNLKRGSASQALSSLQDIPPDQASPEQKIRFLESKAQAQKLAGKMLESASTRTELDPLLTSEERKIENQMEIIQTLSALSDTALELLQPNPPGVVNGWMELTRVFKRYGNNFIEARPAYEAWQQRFPGHPVANGLFGRYYGKVQAQTKNYAQVAVLLPQSGPLLRVATALRNGITAAYQAQPAHSRPLLRFYDSSNPQTIRSLYQQAVAEGAKAVIGPLDKSAVARLAGSGDLPVALLALNQVLLGGAPPANFYQFALSPEDEARQVAERAWHDRHSRAVALVPKTDWGQRVLEAFAKRWQELGGVLVAQQSYKENSSDFSAQIKKLLNLDKSESRYKKLQKNLGRSMEFEPRLRGDAGFIFLAGNSALARQIRPQLLFHHAGKLPTYSTSRVFSGIVNPRLDRDLNGIRFPDIPWILVKEDGPLSREAVARNFPDSRTAYPRLYAMGIDSFSLISQLERLDNGSSKATLDGKTGTLFLDDINQVHRQLVWAEIKKGRPRLIGYAPRMALPPRQPPPPAPAAEAESTPAASTRY